MIKRFLTFFVALLVLWLASPHPGCCCLTAVLAKKESAATHSCCRQPAKTETTSHCHHYLANGERSISLDKDCCKSQSTVLAGSAQVDSSELSSNSPHHDQKPVEPILSISNWYLRCFAKNRAPPAIANTASSRIYLLKRALLI